jgi:hypothetical protein
MKKIILTLLSVAALGTTLSAPLMANAREFRFGDGDHSIGFRDRNSTSYEVFYRRNRREGWQFYGYYNSRFQAEKAAFRLQLKGYRAYVERR